MLDVQWLGMPRPIQEILAWQGLINWTGYSIFYPHKWIDVKIQGIPWLWFSLGVSISRYIFPVGKFAQLPFWGGRLLLPLFWGIIFSKGLSKIKFQGIFVSNNRLFQGILVFKNLVVHTSVWIKNEITQCMGLVNKSLLADLVMMILMMILL